MKKCLLTLCVLSSQAFASHLTIQSFSVIRLGGGQFEAVVSADENVGVSVRVKSCQFRQLTAEEQDETALVLAGIDALEAQAILANQAVLGADQSIREPGLATGTWSSLKVDYTFERPTGQTREGTATIAAPIVLINGHTSTILSRIETQSRAAAASVCAAH